MTNRITLSAEFVKNWFRPVIRNLYFSWDIVAELYLCCAPSRRIQFSLTEKGCNKRLKDKLIHSTVHLSERMCTHLVWIELIHLNSVVNSRSSLFSYRAGCRSSRSWAPAWAGCGLPMHLSMLALPSHPMICRYIYNSYYQI